MVRIVELLDPADPEDGRLLDSQNNDIKQRLRSCSKSSNEEEQSEKDSDSLLDKENVSWLEKADVEKKGAWFLVIVSILSDILSALRPVVVACWIGISLPTWRQVQFYQMTQDWGIHVNGMSMLLRLLEVLSILIIILFKWKKIDKKFIKKNLGIYIL